MFLNVWLVIWPNQQIVIGSARQVLAGGEPDARAADAGKKGARASRANTFFSISMPCGSWCSRATSRRSTATRNAGQKAVYWIFLLAIVGFVEANALGKVGGYDSPFNTKVFDHHRTTIIGGFALWAVLFIIGWELILR